MKKILSVLLVLATWPLLTAGGGINPPPPGFKITGPAVSAVIVVDPHNTSVPGGGRAAIRLTKGTVSTGTIFQVPDTTRDSFFNFGCDPARTDIRFKNAQLNLYVPQAQIDQMYAQLGIPISGANVPFITDTDSAVCTPDDVSGILSFTAVIQFLVPQNH
jgi:hypothetical protein